MNLFAHVKWFVDADQFQAQKASAVELVFVAIFVAAGLALLFGINKAMEKYKFTKKTDKKFQKYYRFVPTLVRLSLGVSLILMARDSFVLAPNIHIESHNYLVFARSLELIAGIGLLLGLITRVWSAFVLALFGLSFLFTSPIDLIEHLEIVGLAGYLLIEGGGAFALDNPLGTGWKEPLKLRKYSLPILRVAVGLGLVVLAFTEKLFNVSIAQEFLSQHQSWNFLSFLNVSNHNFILFIGASELIIGLGIVFNLATRLLAAMVLILFATTAALLGAQEVAGHIFGVGFVAAIWVNANPVNELKKKFRAAAIKSKR